MLPGPSFVELLIVILALIIFIKPEEMPQFFRKVGKAYATVQSFIRRARAFTSQTMDDFTRFEDERAKRLAASSDKLENSPEEEQKALAGYDEVSATLKDVPLQAQEPDNGPQVQRPEGVVARDGKAES